MNHEKVRLSESENPLLYPFELWEQHNKINIFIRF